MSPIITADANYKVCHSAGDDYKQTKELLVPAVLSNITQYRCGYFSDLSAMYESRVDHWG